MSIVLLLLPQRQDKRPPREQDEAKEHVLLTLREAKRRLLFWTISECMSLAQQALALVLCTALAIYVIMSMLGGHGA